MKRPHPPMTQAKDRVAKLCWQQDGKPEYAGMGTVGYSHYRDAARTVIDGLIELGYTITSPGRKASKAAPIASEPQPIAGSGGISSKEAP